VAPEPSILPCHAGFWPELVTLKDETTEDGEDRVDDDDDDDEDEEEAGPKYGSSLIM